MRYTFPHQLVVDEGSSGGGGSGLSDAVQRLFMVCADFQTAVQPLEKVRSL